MTAPSHRTVHIHNVAPTAIATLQKRAGGANRRRTLKFPAANGNRVKAADEVDKFVRAFPVQDDEAIEFCPVRVIAWALKTDLANYARLVRKLNLELATLFS